jgi:hypothetical protein
MLDLAAIAAILSEITGREITRVVAGDEEWVETLVSRGMPRGYAEFGLGVFRASRRGEFAVTDPTLEKLIGRPAESVRTRLEGALADRSSAAPSGWQASAVAGQLSGAGSRGGSAATADGAEVMT